MLAISSDVRSRVEVAGSLDLPRFWLRFVDRHEQFEVLEPRSAHVAADLPLFDELKNSRIVGWKGVFPFHINNFDYTREINELKYTRSWNYHAGWRSSSRGGYP